MTPVQLGHCLIALAVAVYAGALIAGEVRFRLSRHRRRKIER